MPATYEPIASTTLGSAAANVEFTSISGTYTDLVLVCQGKTTTSDVGTDVLRLQVNSDTGSNYSDTLLYGDGSSALSGRASSASRIRLVIPQANATITVPPVFRLSFMSYANTNVFKTVLIEEATEQYIIRRVGLWRDTSAITSIKLSPLSNNLAAGFTACLYGIKAA